MWVIGYCFRVILWNWKSDKGDLMGIAPGLCVLFFFFLHFCGMMGGGMWYLFMLGQIFMGCFLLSNLVMNLFLFLSSVVWDTLALGSDIWHLRWTKTIRAGHKKSAWSEVLIQ